MRPFSPSGSIPRDEACAPWPESEPTGRLDVTATSARKELDVKALPAATADDVLVTADGYEQLCTELDVLRTVRRREMSEQLRDVREDGDPDNPALYDLLEGQAQLEQRIAVLEAQLAAARVVEPGADGVAGIGTRVLVRDRESGEIAEYDLVGSIEADAGNGRVSVAAPVGSALGGRRRGETVTVDTPRGTVRLEILCVGPRARCLARAAA
jgi:transcription elongation factor GreA